MSSSSSSSSDSDRLRGRGFCATLNNYTEIELMKIRVMFTENRTKLKYLIFGKEVAPTTGTPHLQIYVQTSLQMTIRAFQAFVTTHQGFPSRWSVLLSNGSPLQNKVYCSKSSDFEEFGDVPKGQGARSDLDGVKEAILAGASMRDLASSNFNAVVRFNRGIAYARDLLMTVKRSEMTQGYWLFGSTGTGKSRFAHRFAAAFAAGSYVKNGDTKWFCGYDQYQIVIIDDYRPNKDLSFNMLLTLADRYPMDVETKGGKVNFNSPYVIITSPHNIDETFAHLDFLKEPLAQLKRRFKEFDFNNPGILDFLEPVMEEARALVAIPEAPILIRQTNEYVPPYRVNGLVQDEEEAQFPEYERDEFMESIVGLLSPLYDSHSEEEL